MGTKEIIYNNKNISFHIRRLDLHDFETIKNEWNHILKRSSADHLFLSWEWQFNWWKTFAPDLGLELYLLGAFSKDGHLIGLAPFYKSSITIANLLKIKRLQFIGNCYNGQPTVRTEYLDLIIDNKSKHIITAAFFEYINNDNDWDEFVIQDLDVDSFTHAFIVENTPLSNTYCRTIKYLSSYQVNTKQSFDSYIQKLGKNTRKHLYKRRNHLNKFGNVTLKHANKNNLDEFFQTLNKLHYMRWGKNVFTGNRLKFHENLSKLFIEKDQVKFNILSLNDNPLAARINYRVNNREYAIQSGINDKFDKKLSLGILLTGYMIENAISDGLYVYDFLAGVGKKEDYKKYIATNTRRLVTLQFINKWYLQYLYRFNDFLRR